jgi:hypothetical protein
MMVKYKREFVSMFIGVFVVSLIFFLMSLSKEEALESEKRRIREIKSVVKDRKENFKNTESNTSNKPRYIPDKFGSYIVQIKIDMNEVTSTKEAIKDIKQVASIVTTSPDVKTTEIVSIHGRIKKEEKEMLFELNIKEGGNEGKDKNENK